MSLYKPFDQTVVVLGKRSISVGIEQARINQWLYTNFRRFVAKDGFKRDFIEWKLYKLH